MSSNSTTKRDECVGTLLVHQSDMQELSKASPSPTQTECVGSLLVASNDMKELSEAPASPASPENSKNTKTTPTLVKRLTERMRNAEWQSGASPDDEDPAFWVD